MGTLIAMAVKFSGFGWVWEKVDGCKTYIQAVAEMLTGVSGMTAAGAAELSRFVAEVHGVSDLWGFVQGLMHNPDPPAIAFVLAWGVVVHGWGVMAKKHADDKKHAEIIAAGVPPATA